MINLLAATALSYLTGAIPSSYIAGKLLKGIDIRQYGSGNAGATNAGRVLGKKAGYAVFAADFLKGFLCVFIAGRINLTGETLLLPEYQYLIAFASAVAGHIFPVYIGFKGGKGVATAAGGVTALVPFAFPLCITIFAAVYFKTKTVSPASLSAVWGLMLFYIPVSLLLNKDFFIIYQIFFASAAVLITWMHRDNIKRLINGTENRF